MKFSSENIVLISTAVCAVAIFTSSASANKSVDPTITVNSKSLNSNNHPTYTANGKMDKKTAVMLINLLRNPHLQVKAEVNGQRLQTISPRPSMKKPMDVLVNYTITGKTTRSNVLKLKRLMQNSKHIQISAHANINTTPQRFANTHKRPMYPQNQAPFIPSYMPFYSNVTPPTYIQGNIVWMPVLVNQSTTSVPFALPNMIAGK